MTIWGGSKAGIVSIPSGGQLGIGTTSPAYPLTVYSSGNDVSRSWTESDNSGNAARADVYAAAYTPTGSGTNSIGLIQYGSGYSGTLFGESLAKSSLIYSGGADPSKFMIGTGSSIPIYFATAGSKRMTIASSGNVGIGTTSPSSALSIGGAGASNYKLYLNATGVSAGYYTKGAYQYGGWFEPVSTGVDTKAVYGLATGSGTNYGGYFQGGEYGVWAAGTSYNFYRSEERRVG